MNRNEPTGRSAPPSPARPRFTARTTVEIASSWPNTTRRRSLSSFSRASRSEVEAVGSGIFAICESSTSTSRTPTVLRFSPLRSRTAAPTSSMTSIALSGRKRSSRCLAESSTQARSAGAV